MIFTAEKGGNRDFAELKLIDDSFEAVFEK
jgi:hypothetical protein